MLLSIKGMYDFDNTVLDNLIVPEGIDLNDVKDNILLNCAELEVIYPELETMKSAIGIWARSEQTIWKKLLDTMTVEYNPIWNVDANITINDTENQEDTRVITDNSTDDITTGNTDTASVKGFNSDQWAEHDKTVSAGDSNEEYENTHNDGYNSEKTGEHTERRTGNIGVTATQDLIKKEREIAEFNLINYITESFKRRFCLLIY